MPDKVFCDPVHRHIIFDGDLRSLFLSLLDTPEMQRLRRIRQLGVSCVTYPGAEHTRFSHALGTYHLMTQALRSLERNQEPPLKLPRKVEVAAICAALLHDIGHGPFSHLTERVSSLKHEETTQEVILGKTGVNRALRSFSKKLPDLVASLLGSTEPGWQFISDLLASQLDVDRMDYLLRDAYFCGVSFGVYDHRRILHTLRVKQWKFDRRRHPVWLMKGRHAIEEFLYARYYMYWTVYYHKTTRGFEELYRVILTRATELLQTKAGEKRMEVLPWVKALLKTTASVATVMRLDDNILLAQISLWRCSKDAILSDLCDRFLSRRGFKPLGPERDVNTIESAEALSKAKQYLARKKLPPKYYLLYSSSVATGYDYYHPEREEKTPRTSIMLLRDDGTLDEISQVLKGIDALRKGDKWEKYYFVPREHERDLRRILKRVL